MSATCRACERPSLRAAGLARYNECPHHCADRSTRVWCRTWPEPKGHRCVPNIGDEWDGWTNCAVCWKAIRVTGPVDGQCRVVVPWTGPCELRNGHTGRHRVRGIEFNF